MRATVLVGCVVLSVAAVAGGCGGGSGYNSSPSPTPTPTPTPTSGTVNIAGNNGTRSFNPNPGTTASDGTMMWQNTDGVAHHIVANDGSFDSGVIAPGGASSKIVLPAAGTNYHCSIHPGMIGAVKGTGGTAPPCQGPYC